MTPVEHPRGRMVALGAALVLFFAGCSGLRSQVSQQVTQARRAQGSYHDGLARYEAKDYRGAIPHFASALAAAYLQTRNHTPQTLPIATG